MANHNGMIKSQKSLKHYTKYEILDTEHSDRNSMGFTLMESLVATFLAAVIAVSILPVFINSIILNYETKKKQIALKTAESKLEEYRAKSFNEIVDSQPVPESNPAETFSVSVLPQGTGNVYIKNYGSEPKIKEVEVKINWRGKKNQTKDLTLITLTGQSGLND